MKEIILADLGEGVEQVTVSFWRYKVWDAVREGEDIVEVYTDKANFTVKSPATGKLAKITVGEGKTAKVGEAIGAIE